MLTILPRAVPFMLLVPVMVTWSMHTGVPAYAQPQSGRAMLERAAQLAKQGKFEEAIRQAEQARALVVRRDGRRHNNFIVVGRMLAGLHGLHSVQLHKAGRYGMSEKHAKTAVDICAQVYGTAHPTFADSLNNLAELYRAVGRYAEAEPLYKRSLAINEKQRGNTHRTVGTNLFNLANLYQLQKRYKQAEPLYKRALKILENVAGTDHPYVAQTLNSLAALYTSSNRFDEAEPLLKRALAIYEKNPKENRAAIAGSLSNLGAVYDKQRLHAKAEPIYRRALTVREDIFGKHHPEVAISLNNLAVLLKIQGRYGEAEPLYQRALYIRAKALGKTHPSVASTFRNIGLLELQRGRIESAFDNFRRAAAIHEKRALSGVARRRNQDNQAGDGHANAFYNTADSAWSLTREQPARREELTEVAYWAAQWAGRTSTQAALGQMTARAGAGNAKLAGKVRAQQDLLRQWQALDKKLIGALGARSEKQDAQAIADLRAKVAAADKRIAALDVEIERTFPEYAELSNPKPLSIEQTRKHLGADEALLLYMVKDGHQHVWAVTREGVAWKTIARQLVDLQKDVAALRKSLDPVAAQSSEGRGLKREQVCRGFEREAGESATCEAYDTDLGRAFTLYKTLLGPVEPVIAGKRHLMVVPSGPLTDLPFHMLVSKTPPAGGRLDERFKAAEWLIRRHAVTVLPSVSSLRALRVFARKSRAKRPFIGIGDPAFVKPRQKKPKRMRGRENTRGFASYFRGSLADVDQLSGAIPPLPDTADELKAVGKVFKARKSDIILGRKASETTLKTLSSKGLLDDYRVVHFATHGLVAGEIKGLAEPALALSLPSKATEKDDGLLTASEVAQLKLNADWVVLSACNTAAGDKPGAEALSGLARSFFYSGTRALLVSHWPVVSEAAVQLTTKTFALLKADPTIGRAEALRRSMLSLIDDGTPYQRHPSYWAPFIVVGEGGRQGR